MNEPNRSTYKTVCPACLCRMRIRNSVEQTPTFKTMYAQCTNVACGATYTGSLQWDFTLSPSGIERPVTVLPLAPSAKRLQALKEHRVTTDQLDLLDSVEDQPCS